MTNFTKSQRATLLKIAKHEDAAERPGFMGISMISLPISSVKTLVVKGFVYFLTAQAATKGCRLVGLTAAGRAEIDDLRYNAVIAGF